MSLREQVLAQHARDLHHDKVNGFFGDYRWMSNFHPIDIHYRGFIFPTTEHAYQAVKTEDQEFWKKIIADPNPAAAKAIGRECKMRPDWNAIRNQVMYEVNLIKYTGVPIEGHAPAPILLVTTECADLQKKLINTVNMELIENNWWNDSYWGVYQGNGQNMLGKTLMRIRDEIIDDRVDAWHKGILPHCELYEYLGISHEKYARWVEGGHERGYN